jgi:hypothetical protein
MHTHTTHYCRATGATVEMAKGDDVFRHFIKSRSAHMSSEVMLYTTYSLDCVEYATDHDCKEYATATFIHHGILARAYSS